MKKSPQEQEQLTSHTPNKLRESFLSALCDALEMKRGLTQKEITGRTLSVDLHVKIAKEKNDTVEYSLLSNSGLPQHLTINNPDALRQFSQMHGFFPLIEKIYIDDIDISTLADLESLYNFFCYLASHRDEFSDRLYQEIEKTCNTVDLLKKSGYSVDDMVRIGKTIQEFRKVAHQHTHIFGEKSQRNKTQGTIPEKLYTEIAFRLENNVRDALGIHATYMQLDSYHNDVHGAIDIDRLIAHDASHYHKVPLQITTGDLFTEESQRKSLSIGNNVKADGIPSFITSIRGRFSAMTHDGTIAKKYKKRHNDPSIREQQHNKSFPYFFNHLRSNQVDPIKSNYIMCHIVYSAIKNTSSHSDIIPYITSILDGPSRIDSIILKHLSLNNPQLTTLPSGVCQLSLTYTHQGKENGQIVVYF